MLFRSKAKPSDNLRTPLPACEHLCQPRTPLPVCEHFYQSAGEKGRKSKANENSQPKTSANLRGKKGRTPLDQLVPLSVLYLTTTTDNHDLRHYLPFFLLSNHSSSSSTILPPPSPANCKCQGIFLLLQPLTHTYIHTHIRHLLLQPLPQHQEH